jgi:hypothetical protein
MNATSAISRLGQLVVLSLVLTGSHAFGQTITQTGSFVNYTGATGPVNFNFASFNTSLGTLNSVTVELFGVALTGTGQGTNTNVLGGDNELIKVNVVGEVTVASTTDPALTPIDLNVEDTANNKANLVAPGGSTPLYQYGPGVPTGVTVSSGTTAPTSLTPYESGTGPTVTLVVTPSGVGVQGSAFNQGSAPVANASFTGEVSVSGTLELIYNYTPTPVPEPSKTAACMIGFALCVLVGRNYFKGRGFRLA